MATLAIDRGMPLEQVQRLLGHVKIDTTLHIDNHFREVTKMITIGKGGQREIQDFMLTRYACYLIAQNGDSKKEEIAFAQGYFAS